MYRGFQLRINDNQRDNFNDFHDAGKASFLSRREKLAAALENCRNTDGSLDGDRLRKSWFPQVDCHVFLSHSHQDEKLAIGIAGWLQDRFGLIPFVDSCIWGYANQLLKMIDEAHCKNDGSANYDYDKRNYSTAHVHAMLSTALMEMIDRTECLVFLNTPSSARCDGVKDIYKSSSPWIFSEIEASRLIHKKAKEDHRQQTKKAALESFSARDLEINYSLQLAHLSSLTYDNLLNWHKSSCPKDQPTNAIDWLYGQFPLASIKPGILKG